MGKNGYQETPHYILVWHDVHKQKKVMRKLGQLFLRLPKAIPKEILYIHGMFFALPFIK